MEEAQINKFLPSNNLLPNPRKIAFGHLDPKHRVDGFGYVPLGYMCTLVFVCIQFRLRSGAVISLEQYF